MFAGQNNKYDQFRAKFKVWLPSLVTLDGIDFSKDEVKLSQFREELERERQQILHGQLATIPEETRGQTSSAGQQSAAAQSQRSGQRSY